MRENRETWLNMVFELEGGFVNRADDPGLATNMGITQATLEDWRGGPVTENDVKSLTRDEATEIYLARYWNVVRGDQLPSGIDLYVADTAVLQGPMRAAKLLQKVVATNVDGFIGNKTIEAARVRNNLETLLNMHDARMTFLAGLPHWDTFGRGWTNRCNRVLQASRAKIESRPILAEMLPSQTALGGVTAAIGGVIALWPQIEPVIRAGTTHAQDIAGQTGPEGTVAAVMAFGGGLYALWCRYRDWRTGAR